MPPPAPTRFVELLAALVARNVDFVLVGGAAAVLAGAGIATEDLDIVPDLADANLERLLATLAALDAVYFDPAGREIRPDLEKLRSFRLSLLSTRLGRLDLLREIGDGLDYRALLARSIEYDLGTLRIRAANLPTLIEVKEATGREKDRAQLPILREALRLARLTHPDA